MADEARSLKQYGELPEHIRVNDTDAMMEGEENENAEWVAGLGGGLGGQRGAPRRGGALLPHVPRAARASCRAYAAC
jgi:hypothetical protein